MKSREVSWNEEKENRILRLQLGKSTDLPPFHFLFLLVSFNESEQKIYATDGITTWLGISCILLLQLKLLTHFAQLSYITLSIRTPWPYIYQRFMYIGVGYWGKMKGSLVFLKFLLL